MNGGPAPHILSTGILWRGNPALCHTVVKTAGNVCPACFMGLVTGRKFSRLSRIELQSLGRLAYSLVTVLSYTDLHRDESRNQIL
jgi:hypothetical protein